SPKRSLLWLRGLAPGPVARHDTAERTGFPEDGPRRRVTMSAPRKTYRSWDPDAYRQQAHAPATQLPDDDLVFFLLDVVPHLDLTAVYAPSEDQLRGAPPFDPR